MDFAGWIDTWRRVLTQPGEPVFEQEKVNPNGTLQTALIWIVIAAVVAAIFGAIVAALNLTSANAMLSQLPPDVAAQMGPILGMVTGGGGFWAIIMVPVVFIIGTFITHLIAKMLGGQGEYARYAYLVATFQAPITIISSILLIIPFVGGCVQTLLSIYGLVLTYFAVKVNYALTSGKAIAVVLIPIILFFLVLICFATLAISMFAGMGTN